MIVLRKKSPFDETEQISSLDQRGIRMNFPLRITEFHYSIESCALEFLRRSSTIFSFRIKRFRMDGDVSNDAPLYTGLRSKVKVGLCGKL